MLTFGQPVLDRRQILAKALWIGIWLVFLASPVRDLVTAERSGAATLLGSLGLAAFVACYLSLVFRYTVRVLDWRVVYVSFAAQLTLAVLLALAFGTNWLGLFVYVSVSAGAVLPLRYAVRVIPAVTAVQVAVGLRTDSLQDLLGNLAVLSLLIGFAMSGVRQLIRTTVQLRQARATVAQLAANEERLRLARDLHDLLGHSLSLITLKSELAGRMLPAHPEKAAKEVADIEQVSRQALVDVREAVSGYRRRTLAGELAGARTALTAAGIDADVPLQAPDGLPDEQGEAALAWALREAVTNVVRHSSARRCTVAFTARQTLAGPVLELSVEDDGTGGSGAAPGNGLTGLTERVEAVGGTLEAGPAGPAGSAGARGFRLTARVPLSGTAIGSPS
ncbi:sensor histidine kinase [Streptomyces sp. BG9H]|uniref:Sensor histidine kinase n=1 Tax=Streptomyces anatolicus TaxID=2675858 RepID=A0ABS6YQP3_9ACTN|nr:sensor histidine kinase [Streptomyces anatolicus]MBW5423704.1 sensor histidine kinase [Streptomyces anatolicus]